MRYLSEEVKGVVGDIPVLVHCHNDFGMATANTIGAILGGTEGCDVTVNGIGGRAGNASLEEVVFSLEMLCGVKTGIDMTKLYELSKFVEKVTGVKCQPHKAIVRKNSFLEESELHIHGVMKGKQVDLGDLAYLPYAPWVVGQRHKIVWGSTSLWEGDPYMIFATSAAIYTTLLKGEIQVSLADFTPICGLTQDPNILLSNFIDKLENHRLSFFITLKRNLWVKILYKIFLDSPGQWKIRAS